ncbi:bacterial regulatory protein, luxR family [mine drainage metagenome]|uniref:Bacterial regulatory protein, luxR family n=1 Tax=mine drainage metagenome TaxID=410659 RepID=A0A1J5T256_9ZZZZ
MKTPRGISARQPRSRPRGPASTRDEALFELWDRLGRYGAAETDAALKYLIEWIAARFDADNVIFCGALRVQSAAAAKCDPFLGWRLRVRRPLRADSAAYRRQLESYLLREHYGKLTPTYYRRSHHEQQEAHVGMATRALLSAAGKFRVHRLRDGWIDLKAFRRSLHYRLYYAEQGIADRIWIGIPVTSRHEAFFLVDRHQRPGARRRPFTAEEATCAGHAARGAMELLRRLFLDHGLLLNAKPFSPRERQILHALLTGRTEKEIAGHAGLKPATLHQYVKGIYGRLQVKSRAELMSLWLDGSFPGRR